MSGFDVNKLKEHAIEAREKKLWRGLHLELVADEAEEELAATGKLGEDVTSTTKLAKIKKAEAKPNPFTSTLKDIGARSEGLAAYFLTVRFFLVVIFMYCLLAIYSLRDYKKHGGRFQDNFELQFVDKDGSLLYFETCPKYWPVGESFTSFSLGSYCQIKSHYTSPMQCKSKCVVYADAEKKYDKWKETEDPNSMYKNYPIWASQFLNPTTVDPVRTSTAYLVARNQIVAGAAPVLTGLTATQKTRLAAELENAKEYAAPTTLAGEPVLGRCLANAVDYRTLGSGFDSYSQFDVLPFAQRREVAIALWNRSQVSNPGADLLIETLFPSVANPDVVSGRVNQVQGYNIKKKLPRTGDFIDLMEADGRFTAGSQCWRVLPCIFQSDHGPDAPDGICNCCHLEPITQDDYDAYKKANPSYAAYLEPSLGKNESPFNMWMHLGLAGAFFFIMAYWRHWMVILPKQLDELKLTASDYAVVVGPIPEVKGFDNIKMLQGDLRDYCRHWGPVDIVAPIINIGKFAQAVDAKKVLLRTQAELNARKAHGDGKGLSALLYKNMFGGGGDPDKGLEKVGANLDKLHEGVKKLGDDYHVQCLGSAIVVFDDLEAANNFMYDHDPNPLLDLALKIPFIGHGIVRASGTLPVFKTSNWADILTVSTGAEPPDLDWGTMLYSGAQAAFRSWACDLGALGVLAVTAGWQFGMEAVKRQEMDKVMSAATIYKSPGKTVEKTKTIRTQLVTTGVAIGISVINIVLSISLRTLIKLQSKPTKTQQAESLLWKLCFAYLINNFVIPVASATISKQARWSWYGVGGLASQAVSIQISNAVVPTVLAALNPMGLIKKHVVWRNARSQAVMDFLFAPDEFLVADKLANQYKTLALGILFMPIMPISPFIALAALLGSYVNDLYQIHYNVGIPTGLRAHVVKSLWFALPMIPLVQWLFIGLSYFSYRDDAWKFLVASACIWFGLWYIFMLIPWAYILWVLKGRPAEEDVQTLEEAITNPYREYFAEATPVDANYEPDLAVLKEKEAAEATEKIMHYLDELFDMTPEPYAPITDEMLRGQTKKAVVPAEPEIPQAANMGSAYAAPGAAIFGGPVAPAAPAPVAVFGETAPSANNGPRADELTTF